MITRVTGKNQVTIPAEIARKEGVRPGARLEWRTTNRERIIEVHILPDRESLALALRGRGNSHRRRSGSPVRRLVADREREARMDDK